jgi:hypothetical protein
MTVVMFGLPRADGKIGAGILNVIRMLRDCESAREQLRF